MLSSPVEIEILPGNLNNSEIPLSNQNMEVYVPGEGWRPVEFNSNGSLFDRDEKVLRRWYNVEGELPPNYTSTAFNYKNVDILLFPNPFTNAIQFSLPDKCTVFIYDKNGKLVSLQNNGIWTPDALVKPGLYFVTFKSSSFCITKKVIYLK